MKKLIYLFTVFLLVGVIFSASAYSEINKDEFVVKVGLIKKIAEEKYIVYKETTQIPYITKSASSGFTFGYTIRSENDAKFYSYAVINMPVVASVSGDVIGANKKENKRLEVVTKTIFNKGYWYYALHLDDGDPPGLYSVDVYINNELLKKIEFNILSPIKNDK